MKRLLVFLVLAAASLSVTAATTVKGSRANSSAREQAPAAAVADEDATPDTVDKKPTTVNGVKSNTYRVPAPPFGRGGQQGQPGPVESSNLNSSRSNTFRTETGQPQPGLTGAPSQPESAKSINLNSGLTNVTNERESLKGTTKSDSESVKNSGHATEQGVVEYKDGEDGVNRSIRGGKSNGDARTTIRGGKSNSTSERLEGGKNDGVPTPAEATTVKGMKSNSDNRMQGQQGAAERTVKSQGKQGSTERSGSTKAECDAMTDAKAKQECNLRLTLNTNITSRLEAPGVTPNPGPAEATTMNTSKSVSLRRGTPETNPPKSSAADNPAQDQRPFHF